MLVLDVLLLILKAFGMIFYLLKLGLILEELYFLFYL